MEDIQTISYRIASPNDVEALLSLRLRAMRGSLERVGRFDPDRARARFLASFQPDLMRLAYLDEEFVGCVTVREEQLSASWIEHFYIEPEYQSRGFGGRIMLRLIDEAEAQRRVLRLAVLRDSDADRFYRRYGFVEVRREEWDIFYERRPASLTGLPEGS